MSTFIDLMREGWVSFVLARLVAVALVALAIRRVWRSYPRVGVWVTASLLLGLAAFGAVKSYSPAGTYGFIGEIERPEPSRITSFASQAEGSTILTAIHTIHTAGTRTPAAAGL